MNDHVVAPILRDLTGAHVAAHSHIEKHVPVPHGPRSRRDKGLHDSLPIDPPEHPPLTGCAAGLVPSEVEAHRTGVHIRDGGAHGTVLERLVVEAPMQTRLVLVVGVPRFGHIGLAVSRPHTKGSQGSSQNAGQMPSAQGSDSTAVKTPASRPSVCRLTRRADVKRWWGSAAAEFAIARRTSLPSPVLSWGVHVVS